MEERERRVRQRLKDDFPHYASRCLWIKTKGEGLQRLELNEAQLHLHRKLEEQRERTGKVRALVLKGRQQGCSTYVGARFFHRVTHRKGTRAYILTHEDKATQNLFEMTHRYHEHVPPLVRPRAGAANANELVFDKLDSGYSVGTARSKGTGRSLTIQLFHGSEVAFWPNADTHVAGVLQAVPDLPGTEIILESTSNGPDGVFHSMCMDAHRGESEYQLIFIPWFWSREYRKELPEGGIELTGEEQRYQEAYGLDLEQAYWRRMKTRELGGPHHFRREYPATVEEAFKAAAVGALWTQELLDKSRVPSMPEDADGNPLEFVRIGTAVDPSGGNNPKRNDEQGIITGGLATDGVVYLWADDSGHYTPDGWGKKAVAALKRAHGNAIVAESNFGGQMVEHVIRTADRHVAVKMVTASRGKDRRAEPVVAQYERGKVKHVGNALMVAEDEMVTWVPGQSDWSPNRLDAVVWLVYWLVLGTNNGVKQSSF